MALLVCLFPPPLTDNSNKMPRSGPPTEEEIWKIARRTAKIIESNISPNVCLFGSAASSLWADIDRVPNVRRATRIYLFILLFG
jgi:hypothetical protein